MYNNVLISIFYDRVTSQMCPAYTGLRLSKTKDEREKKVVK